MSGCSYTAHDSHFKVLGLPETISATFQQGRQYMTDKEKKVIEVLRLHMCKNTGEPIQHDSYPEELTIPQGERPCDATWRGPHVTYAIEHTTIDSFRDNATTTTDFAD